MCCIQSQTGHEKKICTHLQAFCSVAEAIDQAKKQALGRLWFVFHVQLRVGAGGNGQGGAVQGWLQTRQGHAQRIA